jgi:hypothetical protein
MALMVAMSVAPAWAAPNGYGCTFPDGGQVEYSFGQFKHGPKTDAFDFPVGTYCDRQSRL